MSEPLVLAGRTRRLIATIIDAVLVPGLTVVLVMLTNVAEDAEDYASNAWMLWALLLAVVSYLILNGALLWRRGQTLGKWITGIAIVPADAQVFEPASWWKLILVRALFFPMLFALLPPWILIPIVDQATIFNRSRRCLHDYAAGTKVVRVT